MAFNKTYVSGWEEWATQNPRAHASYTQRAAPFDLDYRGSRGVTSAKIASFSSRLQSSALGRALRIGTMESFGWHFQGNVSQGFLGIGKPGTKFMEGTRVLSKMTGEGMFRSGLRVAKATAHMGTHTAWQGAKQASVLGTSKAVAGTAGRTLMKSLGLLSTAYFAYEGYQREGVWGAMKGIGESIAYSTAFNLALGGAIGATSLAFAAPVAGLAAVAGATYMLGEAGIAHAKGLRDLEMGGGDQMQQTVTSAGTATARQRSLQALNNTHINGRMAIGNEAFLLHRGFSVQ